PSDSPLLDRCRGPALLPSARHDERNQAIELEESGRGLVGRTFGRGDDDGSRPLVRGGPCLGRFAADDLLVEEHGLGERVERSDEVVAEALLKTSVVTKHRTGSGSTLASAPARLHAEYAKPSCMDAGHLEAFFGITSRRRGVIRVLFRQVHPELHAAKLVGAV